MEYVRRGFPENHTQHLRSEPMVPYNTDLYSVGYPRGDDVNLEEYIKNAKVKNDSRLFSCIQNNLKVNLILNKPTIPIFCQGSRSVIITVTTQTEKNWLYQILWKKHFIETDQHIRYLPSDPEYCNFQSLATVLNFKNQYIFPVSSKQQLFQDFVINNRTNSWYFDPDRFIEYDRNQHLFHLKILICLFCKMV